MRDAGPMVPTGLGHWTDFFDGPLPQAQLERLIPWAISIHTSHLWQRFCWYGIKASLLLSSTGSFASPQGRALTRTLYNYDSDIF